MATNQNANKIEYYGKVLIDLTNDNVTADKMLVNTTAHDKSGQIISGNIPDNGAISKEFDGIYNKSATIPAGYTTGGVVKLGNNIDEEVVKQYELIEQIKLALSGHVNIPYKAELEYLECSGTQWIDTGLTVNTATDEIELAFEITETTVYKWIFGEHDNNARFGLGSGDGTNKRNVAYGNNTYKVQDSQVYNSMHVLTADQNGIFIDSTKIANFSSFSSTSTLYLFNLNLNSGTYVGKSKIWNYKHKRNGVLLVDLMPVLDQNDVPCMYDKVTREFYYNQGTGTFLYQLKS